jgi:hypothetical protein
MNSQKEGARICSGNHRSSQGASTFATADVRWFFASIA